MVKGCGKDAAGRPRRGKKTAPEKAVSSASMTPSHSGNGVGGYPGYGSQQGSKAGDQSHQTVKEEDDEDEDSEEGDEPMDEDEGEGSRP